MNYEESVWKSETKGCSGIVWCLVSNPPLGHPFTFLDAARNLFSPLKDLHWGWKGPILHICLSSCTEQAQRPGVSPHRPQILCRVLLCVPSLVLGTFVSSKAGRCMAGAEMCRAERQLVVFRVKIYKKIITTEKAYSKHWQAHHSDITGVSLCSSLLLQRKSLLFSFSLFLLLFSPEAAIIMSLVCILPVKSGAAHISLSELEGIVVQLLTCIWLFATPWTVSCQASLSFTISRSLLKLMSTE